METGISGVAAQEPSKSRNHTREALVLSVLVGGGLFGGLFGLDRIYKLDLPVKVAIGLAGGAVTLVAIKALDFMPSSNTAEKKSVERALSSGSSSAEGSKTEGDSAGKSVEQTGSTSSSAPPEAPKSQMVRVEPDHRATYTPEELATYQPAVMAGLHKDSKTKRPLRLEIIKAREAVPATGNVEVMVKDPVSREHLEACQVKMPATDIERRETPFEIVGPNVWWPNFSDTRLGCGWQRMLGAQEEMLFEQSHQLQQLHQRAKTTEDSSILLTREGGSEPGGRSKSILFKGLSKDCRIDLGKYFLHPFRQGQTTTVYGDWFEMHPLMPYEEMKAKKVVEVLEQPESFNVFCMTAPDCGSLLGEQVGRDHIVDLGSTAITSYSLIAQTSTERQTVLGGWWGAGVFKNPPALVALIQMTAAQVAGVDYVHHDFPAGMYKGHWKYAEGVFQEKISPMIEKGCTIGAIWDRMAELAQEHQWECLHHNPVPDAT